MKTPHKHAEALAQQEPVLINGLTESETSASMSVMGLAQPEQELDWMKMDNEDEQTLADRDMGDN